MCARIVLWFILQSLFLLVPSIFYRFTVSTKWTRPLSVYEFWTELNRSFPEGRPTSLKTLCFFWVDKPLFFFRFRPAADYERSLFGTVYAVVVPNPLLNSFLFGCLWTFLHWLYGLLHATLSIGSLRSCLLPPSWVTCGPLPRTLPSISLIFSFAFYRFNQEVDKGVTCNNSYS